MIFNDDTNSIEKTLKSIQVYTKREICTVSAEWDELFLKSPIENFVDDLIGEGFYARVSHASKLYTQYLMNLRLGSKFAVKRIFNIFSLECIFREIKVLTELFGLPYIIPLLHWMCVFELNGILFIIDSHQYGWRNDYSALDALNNLLCKREDEISWVDISMTFPHYPKTIYDYPPKRSNIWICYQIGCMLKELHKLKVSHGDVHARNILCNAEGIPILADFGKCKWNDQVAIQKDITDFINLTKYRVFGEQNVEKHDDGYNLRQYLDTGLVLDENTTISNVCNELELYL